MSQILSIRASLPQTKVRLELPAVSVATDEEKRYRIIDNLVGQRSGLEPLAESDALLAQTGTESIIVATCEANNCRMAFYDSSVVGQGRNCRFSWDETTHDAFYCCLLDLHHFSLQRANLPTSLGKRAFCALLALAGCLLTR